MHLLVLSIGFCYPERFWLYRPVGDPTQQRARKGKRTLSFFLVSVSLGVPIYNRTSSLAKVREQPTNLLLRRASLQNIKMTGKRCSTPWGICSATWTGITQRATALGAIHEDRPVANRIAVRRSARTFLAVMLLFFSLQGAYASSTFLALLPWVCYLLRRRCEGSGGGFRLCAKHFVGVDRPLREFAENVVLMPKFIVLQNTILGRILHLRDCFCAATASEKCVCVRC